MLRGQDVLILITGSETPGGEQHVYAINHEQVRYSKSSGFNDATGVVARVDIKWTNGTNFTLYDVAEMKE